MSFVAPENTVARQDGKAGKYCAQADYRLRRFQAAPPDTDGYA